MVLSRCRNLSGTETILSYVKLTFKSTWGTDTIRKLAETDPKSALRLPKWGDDNDGEREMVKTPMV